jgi:hypothetical protein
MTDINALIEKIRALGEVETARAARRARSHGG